MERRRKGRRGESEKDVKEMERGERENARSGGERRDRSRGGGVRQRRSIRRVYNVESPRPQPPHLPPTPLRGESRHPSIVLLGTEASLHAARDFPL